MRWLVLVLAAGLTLSCSGPSVSLDEDPSEYEEQVRELEQDLEDDPEDVDALRALGTIFMRTGRPARAYDLLKKAFAQTPNDPQTIFFLGLASEGIGKRQAAIELLGRYSDVPAESDYRTLMEGRYAWLVRQEARASVRQLIEQERAIADRAPSPRVVAVLPFEFQGGDERFQPLGRGLAEMVSTDLTNIERLQLVERVRLQALLDELELAQSEYVDDATAPRVGQLLGAGRLVSGSYLVTGGDELRLDLSLASLTEGGQVPATEAETGPLDRLFVLQKQIVFRVVDLLDIELTPQEREAIEPVPTRNLQAFLAFSRGLLEEDNGNFGAARQLYQQAQQLDPGFEAPAQRTSRVEGMEAAAGAREKAIAAGIRTQSRVSSQQQRSLMNRRLRRMTGIRRAILERNERNPSEQTTASEELLPLPPAPPGTSNTGGQ